MMTTMPHLLSKPKKPKFDHNAKSYKGVDSREGRLHEVKTDRGAFRFKDNHKDE